MRNRDDIITPIEAAPTQRRSWPVRVFRIMLMIFVVIHLYALALKFLPVPGTILMGQRALSGEDVRRDWKRLEDISPFLVSAVIAGEDARFCQHEGIDWEAVQDAITDNETRKQRRGGSTITQQTAKNVFLWNGGGFVRKVPETWMASFIDFIWGKPRTMEVYLNVAEWGDGLFGAETAAQARFNKPAKDLNAREAALLAAVLPSPNKWRLDPPGDYVNKRARTLQARLYVVRNEGYADCVLGKATKRIGPAPKPKPEPEEEEPEKKEASEESKPEEIRPEPSEITEEALEPVVDDDQTDLAPESETDTGVEIKPDTP